ncbi:MAG: formylglycine-generating enzyme family protein [Limisphaerales bacterium]
MWRIHSLTDNGWRSLGRSWLHPSFSQTWTNPVVGMHWSDAVEFCKWLTDRECTSVHIRSEYRYRLPPRTSPVGSFPANLLGIRDLGGNVQEWVGDQDYTLRGGSWYHRDEPYLRSNSENTGAGPHRYETRGFRIALACDRCRKLVHQRAHQSACF